MSTIKITLLYKLPILLVLIVGQTANSQNVQECEKLVDLVLESYNKNEITPFKEALSHDFSFANYKAPLAKLILNQLFHKWMINSFTKKN